MWNDENEDSVSLNPIDRHESKETIPTFEIPVIPLQSPPPAGSSKKVPKLLPSGILRLNTLNTPNQDFAANPYYPTYIHKRVKKTEIDENNDESGIELDYLTHQRNNRDAIREAVAANIKLMQQIEAKKNYKMTPGKLIKLN